MRTKDLTFWTCLVALAWAASPLPAAPPAPGFTGTVVRVSDGDTYIVKRDDDSVAKVRLHWADCPEVAHYKSEVDQPFGRQAAEYVKRELLGKTVIVKPVGESYGRIVADMELDTPELMEPFDVAALLTMSGYAQVDKRYKPSAKLLDLETLARKRRRGLWSQPKPMTPWEWRKVKKTREW